MRFHILSLSHTKATDEYSVCAFTSKARLLSRMLTDLGHTTYFYATAGSDARCSELIEVLDEGTFRAVHGGNDWRAGAFDTGRDNAAYRTFTANAIREIAGRARPGDFLLATFGIGHREIADALPHLIVVESGIGYDHCFARWRVYESQAWANFHAGKEGRGLNPDWYHVVIPNYLDLAQFEYREQKEPFHLFIGRPTALKGRQIAVDVCRELGIPLYVAGQGPRDVPEGVIHLGVLGPGERAHRLARASAFWCPTYYIEPFGTVAVEAMASGTPVLSTDFGAFGETVLHGVTGYRCRTMDHFRWAARNVHRIRPADCRAWAENFGLERVGAAYQEYFSMLADLHAPGGAGWYTDNPERAELGWLERRYPR